jgi:mannose-1-phosphate guanylyltransferase
VILLKTVGLGVWHMVMNINNNSPKPNKKAEESKAIKKQRIEIQSHNKALASWRLKTIVVIEIND